MLWGKWIEAVGETEDALSEPMLDANDDLQACMFDALHGYYRTAFSSLRNVLEVMTIGTCGAVRATQCYENWQSGTAEFGFGVACDLLSIEPRLGAFHDRMRVRASVLVGCQKRRLTWRLRAALVQGSMQLRALSTGLYGRRRSLQ